MPPKTKSPREKYGDHKRSAGYRGIGFELTFEEWYNIWIQSGYWEQRGNGKNNYCMSRYGDVGPYSKDNVFIQTNYQNGKDQKGRSKPVPWCIGVKHTDETKQKRKQTLLDKNINHDHWSGKTMTLESSLKKSQALKGKPWSEARRNAQRNKNAKNVSIS